MGGKFGTKSTNFNEEWRCVYELVRVNLVGGRKMYVKIRKTPVGRAFK